MKLKITQLTPRQKEIAKDIFKKEKEGIKNFVIKSPRQCGKSILLQKMIVAIALRKPNQKGGFYSIQTAQVDKFFEDIKDDYSRFLNLKKCKGRTLKFKNGTTVNGYSATNPNSGIGDTYDFLMCDEHALWRKDKWDRTIATIDAKDAISIVASTPRGKYNSFYVLYKEGKEPTNKNYISTVSYDMTKYDCIYPTDYHIKELRGKPFFTKKQMEHRRNTMSKKRFQEEYMGAFVDNLSSVFPYQESQQLVENWEPYTSERRYYFGIDYSAEGEDDTIVTIINDLGKIAKIVKIESKDPAQQAKDVAKAINEYHCVFGFGEKNGIGSVYNSVLSREINRGTRLVPFVTTNERKAILVEITNELLYEKGIEIPTNDLCYDLNYQMGIYEAKSTSTGKIKYEHPTGQHDDYVDSLMLAIYAFKRRLYYDKKR